jgi:hypothetical protein
VKYDGYAERGGIARKVEVEEARDIDVEEEEGIAEGDEEFNEDTADEKRNKHSVLS